MELTSNTVLITGGATGIGLALAERFLQAGNEVIICGRREEKLRAVKENHPAMHIRVCDVTKPTDRISLFEWATDKFPGLNVLINNAGIQRRFQIAQKEEWCLTEEEISSNFDAPVHLAALFIPHLIKQQRPSIINITSGLSFVPMSSAPVYCATKAALHSFTLSLRHQLAKTPISVIEIIPPAVQTDLGGPGLHANGVPLQEFTDAAMNGLKNNALEISYGFSEKSSKASRTELDEIFRRMNPS